MADVAVTLHNAVYAATGLTAPVTVTPDAITTGQSFEVDVDGLSDRVILLLEKADTNAITIALDRPTPDGFSGENLPAVSLVTPAAAGTFLFGPFESARFKHNVNAGADAGKITGSLSGTLTSGTLTALVLPKGVG